MDKWRHNLTAVRIAISRSAKDIIAAVLKSAALPVNRDGFAIDFSEYGIRRLRRPDIVADGSHLSSYQRLSSGYDIIHFKVVEIRFHDIFNGIDVWTFIRRDMCEQCIRPIIRSTSIKPHGAYTPGIVQPPFDIDFGLILLAGCFHIGHDRLSCWRKIGANGIFGHWAEQAKPIDGAYDILINAGRLPG